MNDEQPVGWAEWEAWQGSEGCARGMQMICDELRHDGVDPKKLGFLFPMTLMALASEAFSAGLDAGLKLAAPAPTTPGGGER